MESFAQIIKWIGDHVEGWPFIILCLFAGLYFTIRTRFLQLRFIKRMWSLLFKGKSSKSGISSFQSFVLALSGRVGTGNIVGVATAIALGGPGAVFWMWIIAFFGAGTAYIEASLGQVYKEKIDGNYRGGPAYYILKGIGVKWYAIAFAVVAIIALGIFLPGLQGNAICEAIDNSFGVDRRITAGVVVGLLGLVIFGGVRRIAKVAEIITPLMAVGYVIVAIVILVLNHHHIPEMFALIVKSAFGMEPALSGMVGAAISMGVRRGLFSNEAGQGTAPHAAAASEVNHPAEQGLVQAFSVYVDTLLVCTATAFIILSTGMYNVYDPDSNIILQGSETSHLIESYGAINTQLAVDATVPGFGSGFVAIALFFFAFTTIMSYYFQAESNIYFLFREHKKKSRLAVNILRVSIMVLTYFGAVNALALAWNMADIGVGVMAWLNLVAILILRKVAMRTFNDYESQLKAGVEDPAFDPDKLGIKNTGEWNKINKQKDKN